MSSLLKSNISQSIGQALIDDLFLGKSRYYYGIGRCYSWETDDDKIPPNTIDTEKYETQVRNDTLFLKKIDSTSVSFVIPRIDYQPNIVYDFYDDSVNMDGKNYYVLTTDFNVYKCLYNNNGQPSYIQPFGVSNKAQTYSDGYVWKFIYTIPASLRTKFLTFRYMPVYNAITEKYYSRGSINSVQITSSGENYEQDSTTIVVSGDGFLEFNPAKFVQFIIDSSGSGYTTVPEVSVADPFVSTTEFSFDLPVVQGQILKVSDSSGIRFYRVESDGITSSTIAPTHYYSVFNNGTASLRHVGIKPNLSASIDDSAVGSVKILEPGFGYFSDITATKSSPGSGAVLDCVSFGGSLQSVNVFENGTGYTDKDIVVSEPYTNGVAFVPSTSYARDDIIFATVSGETFYYKVDIAGTSGLSAPSHTTGGAMNGTMLLTVVAKRARAEAVLGIVTDIIEKAEVNNIKVKDGGDGYLQGTVEVEFSGGNPDIPATANAVVVNGAIKEIIITYPGYGYESTPTVTVNNGTTPAEVEVEMQFGYGYAKSEAIIFSEPDDVDGLVATGSTTTQKTEARLAPIIVDGKIRGIQIIDGGISYTSAQLSVLGAGNDGQLVPIFGIGDLTTIQAQTELTAIKGTLSSVVVTNKGQGVYSASIEIDGDGVGGEVVPVISNGQLQEIKVIQEGSGYTYANLIITTNPEVSVPPESRVIISPINGHASNPISELGAKSVSFYEIFSSETNNGFLFDNSFRQVAIYKNPNIFASSRLLNNRLASTCLVITTSVDTLNIEKNIILTCTKDSSQYRVVSFNETGILAQPMTKYTLEPNDSLTYTFNNISYTIVVKNLSTPRANKYSGDILFVENYAPFSPTSDSAVSINTTINLI